MSDLLGLALVTAAMVGVLALMVRGMRPRGGAGSAGAARVTDLRRYTANPREGGALVGFMSTMAVLGAMAAVGAGGTTVVAGVMGVGFAVISGGSMRAVRGVIGAVAGVAGTTAAFAGLVAAAACSGATLWPSLAIGCLIVVVAAVAALASGLVARRSWVLGPLAVYGALEIMAFFTLPLGIPLLDSANPVVALVTAIVGAVFFGALAGFVPDVALVLGGAAILLASVGTAALWGTTCSAIGDFDGLVGAITFAVSYGLVRLVTRRFAG